MGGHLRYGDTVSFFFINQAEGDDVVSVCLPLAAMICYPDAKEAAPLWHGDGSRKVLQEAALALLAETASRDARVYVKSQVGGEGCSSAVNGIAAGG